MGRCCRAVRAAKARAIGCVALACACDKAMHATRGIVMHWCGGETPPLGLRWSQQASACLQYFSPNRRPIGLSPSHLFYISARSACVVVPSHQLTPRMTPLVAHTAAASNPTRRRTSAEEEEDRGLNQLHRNSKERSSLPQHIYAHWPPTPPFPHTRFSFSVPHLLIWNFLPHATRQHTWVCTDIFTSTSCVGAHTPTPTHSHTQHTHTHTHTHTCMDDLSCTLPYPSATSPTGER